MIIDAVLPMPAQNFFDTEFFYQADLLQDAFWTVIIEVPLFYLCGYRKVGDCLYFAAVNVISNLLLNEFLELTDAALYWQIILPCEITVVLLEFVLCSYRFVEGRKKLLKVIIFTNAVSFLIGLALYDF